MVMNNKEKDFLKNIILEYLKKYNTTASTDSLEEAFVCYYITGKYYIHDENISFVCEELVKENKIQKIGAGGYKTL